MAYEQHNDDNQECPAYKANAVFGTKCTCRDERDVENLRGQDLLDALTEAWNNKHYKGWTFSELNRGASVLPTTVYDEKSDDRRIVRHECIVAAQLDHGETIGLTLMMTTPEGTVLKDFVPAQRR